MTTTSISAPNLDVGRVMQRTFAVLGRNFAVFALLAVCFSGLPSLIAGLVRAGVVQDKAGKVAFVASIAVGFVQFMGAYVLQGALTHGTIADRNGRKAAFTARLATGLRYAAPLLALGIVTVIALAFGFLLLVFPAVMMMCAWAVSVPSLVIDRRGVFGSFGRSAQLTRGQRWPIFGLLLLYAAASWVISALIMLPTGALAAAKAGGGLPVSPSSLR